MILKYLPNNYHQISGGGCCFYCLASFFDDQIYIDIYNKNPNGNFGIDGADENALLRLTRSAPPVIGSIIVSKSDQDIRLTYDQVFGLIEHVASDNVNRSNFCVFPCVIPSTAMRSPLVHRIYLIRYIDEVEGPCFLYIDPRLIMFPVIRADRILSFFIERKIQFIEIGSLGPTANQIYMYNKSEFKHLFENHECNQ